MWYSLLIFILLRLLALVFSAGLIVLGWMIVYHFLLRHVPVFRAVFNL